MKHLITFLNAYIIWPHIRCWIYCIQEIQVLEIQLCQTMSKHAQHHMEHRWFPNEEVQNGYLSYFVNLDPHHVVPLVDSSVEAIQHVLPLNILLINEFQVMIAPYLMAC